MNNKEFSLKYKCPIEVARLIFDKNPTKIRVRSFDVYDEFNPSDPELIKMNNYLLKHPNCEKVFFKQSGPCSNWGYDIIRMETNKEFEKRMKLEIKNVKERIFFIKENKNKINKYLKSLEK